MSITFHALRRCEERYGYLPTEHEGALAVLDIVEGRAILLMRGDKVGREHWLVRIGPVQVRAIYEPATATIVTVYAKEMGAGRLSERVRQGGVRAATERPARFEHGKWMKRKTCWREERR